MFSKKVTSDRKSLKGFSLLVHSDHASEELPACCVAPKQCCELGFAARRGLISTFVCLDEHGFRDSSSMNLTH